MSRDEPPSPVSRSERFLINYWILCTIPGLIVFGIFLLFLRLGGSPSENTDVGVGRPEESELVLARQSLARQTDLNTCRSALQQINSQLSRDSQRRAAPPAEQIAWLRDVVGLDEGEQAEVAGSNYTRLDEYHLDSCFLMRDAVRTLEVKKVPGAPAARATGPERAAAVFAWMVRQVRLREQGGEPSPPSPPAFVLRRGWGTSLERAFIFLSLLEQVSGPDGRPDLLGCVLFVPGPDERWPLLWACGVLVGDGKDLYLFDPRLGLPLPGPGGKGIATLAEARARPEVLGQLKLDDKHHYDVTAEKARKAWAGAVCPLSALAPRMRVLQDKLLAPAVRAHLAADLADDLRRLKAACPAAEGGKEPAVRAWKPGMVLLRHFLPPDEGGVDKGEAFLLASLRGFTLPDDPSQVKMQRRQRFTLAVVPWTAMPVQFQDPNLFPYNIGLGQRVRDAFARPFIVSALEPGGPRDLLLRGRWSKATNDLMEELDLWRTRQKQLAASRDLDKRAGEWLQRAIMEHAQQLRAKSPQEQEAARARIDALWRDSEAIFLLLQGAMAKARIPEVAYLLGLCMQEQAEQLQTRLDLQARAGASPSPADVAKARNLWGAVVDAWTEYLENNPRHPDTAAARRMKARAQALRGDAKAAVASCENLSGNMTELEKLAALYQARQFKGK